MAECEIGSASILFSLRFTLEMKGNETVNEEREKFSCSGKTTHGWADQADGFPGTWEILGNMTLCSCASGRHY